MDGATTTNTAGDIGTVENETPMPRTFGQYKFEAIFALTGGWASVVRSDEWRKPFKFMGPIKYGKQRRQQTKVVCKIEEVELQNDDGKMIDGVCAHCSRCEHLTESFGVSDRSVRRCLVLMREECPRSENNYYFERA
jgi:hypothetical protein